jgi:hypothetical protein
VEIAVAVAKARGFVTIPQLAGCRAGKYFEHYREHAGGAVTLEDMCGSVGLRPLGNWGSTMRLGEHPAEGYPGGILGVEQESWHARREPLVQEALKQLTGECQRRAGPRGDLLREALDTMYRAEEVEVVSPRRVPFQVHLAEPVLLTSLAAVRVQTWELVARRWDRLFCVAESGKWLLERELIDLVPTDKTRQMCVIVADRVREQELMKVYQDRVRLTIKQMPWWLHNRHMLVVVDGRKPMGAIYFERRLRDLAISPVSLTRRPTASSGTGTRSTSGPRP